MYHVISYVFINKSSVITSSSIESYLKSSPDSEQVDSPLLSSSMSLSLLLISDVSIFWHRWHKHPGPQMFCLFLQPHLKVLHPFKQLHPFVKNSIFYVAPQLLPSLGCLCCWDVHVVSIHCLGEMAVN